ncbi:HAD family hydrolase [Longivirga aurantiaca]|uniref:HAD family hydrolase n=1 Tax=Longivirga aurantiaca TaxID=1837743 RepID=A0ABW1SX09_9ACTN
MRVIGFDLDMTIVDSSEAIVDSVAAVGRRWDVPIDEGWLRATLGLPLDLVFPQLVPEIPYAEALEVYRARYLSHGLAMHDVLPGARESLETVVADGFSILVVSAKKDTHVRAVLQSVDLDHLVAEVVGERFAEGKSESLREFAAEAYVGDHPGDVRGALGAGAVAIAVATGPTSASELAAAGADVVLDDLTTFVPWWRAWLDGADAPAEETA